LREKLKEMSRQEGSTLFMTLLTAYQSFLSRYTGQEDILVGSPIANRNYREIEGLIGFFVNTLVYRADMTGNPTFQELLSQVREKALRAHEYQDVPFEKIVEVVQTERSTSHSPIFQTMFTMQDTPRKQQELVGRSLEMVEIHTSIAKFDLTLSMADSEEGLFLAFEYNTDLFDSSTIERMTGHFENWLHEIVHHPDVPLSGLALMSKEEQKQLLEEWNDTKVEYPCENTIHSLFEDQVKRTPDAVAVVDEYQQLTYRELNEKANQLACYLQKQGVGPESLVGLCVEKSSEMIVGVLGILKAGGAYVPLDPSYPENRLKYFLENSQMKVLLTKEALTDWLPDYIQAIYLDEDQAEISKESCLTPVSGVTARDLAYIIYTSGSTGNPKGVMVEHRAVVRLVKNTNYLDFNQGHRILQTGSIVFDASTFEIWGALLNGGELYLIDKDQLLTPEKLKIVIDEHQITTVFLTTQLFCQLVGQDEEVFAGLQNLLVGGDMLLPEHMNKLRRKYTHLNINHVYGPTENTTFSTFYPVTKEYVGSVPIGKSITNSTAYVVNSHMQLQPIGVTGELCVGGDGLARGYLHNPEMTTEKFIDHPFVPGEKLYRTGDLVKMQEDGNIVFMGRLDHQVKIRGYRIEPGEIIHQLLSHESVRDAVVIVREDQPGDKRLIAYVVGDGDVIDWREHLKAQLPSYMIPSHFVEMETLPLTSNGKIDRKALPIPEEQAGGGENHLSPVEELIASVWSQVLGVSNIGAQDSFFELGGHSLLATQVVSRLQEAFQIELPLRELFEHSTVETLARRIGQLRQGDQKRELPPLVPVERGEAIPLSYAQQRLWFIDRFTPNSALYNIPAVLRLTGDWALESLEKGWNQLLERHESLRTVIQEIDDQPVQQIRPYSPETIPVMNVTELPKEA
ncbi:amino acid adenylation domain-containing protein, partial [Thermoactinomyces sp. DSM 45892]